MADHGHEKFKVETEYTVDDSKATPVAKRLERAFHSLGHETHKLREKFHEFRSEQRFTAAAMLGVGFGIGAWVEKSKEAVASFGAARKSIAGMLSETLNWPTAVEGVERYQHAAELASEITEQLEETTANYGGTLEEAASGFRGLTAAVGSAHLRPKQLMELYDQVAATAKATSTDVGTAAELIGKAIMTGSVRPVGVLGKELYSTLHAHGKLTKQMGVSGRLGLVTQMMKGQKPVAEEMSKGVGDSLRKIQHSVEQVFQKVGTPLFNAVSKELNSWAKSMTQAEHSAKPLAELVGDKLVKGFEVAKDITAWLVDHWKLIAGIWATFKVGSVAGGLAGGFESVSNILGGSSYLGTGFKLFGGGLGKLAGAIGPVVLGLGALHLGLQALTDWIDKKMDVKRGIQMHGQAMSGAAGILQSLQGAAAGGPLTAWQARVGAKAVKDLIDSGSLRDGKLDRGAMIANVGKMEDAAKARLADDLGIRVRGLPVSQMAASQFADALAARLEPILAAHPELLPTTKKAEGATEFDVGKLKTKGVQIGPFTGDITINQKFDDVDPDRVWVAIRRDIQENSQRAVQSMHGLGE